MATIGDYISVKLKQWNAEVSEENIAMAFTLSGVNKEEELTPKTEVKSAFKVLYRLIPDILLFTPKSVSEGGFSITYDKDAMYEFYSMIARKTGMPNEISGKNTVRDITNKW